MTAPKTGLPSDWSAPRTPNDIPGWFRWRDVQLFVALLDAHADEDGVIVEIGSHLGRSAVVIGGHLGNADRFVVIDLFGADDLLTESAHDRANDRERRGFFGNPTRHIFEANYRALHPQLPEIVQRPSREILDHVEPGSARFVHVDASHLYDQVAEDTRNAKVMLRPDGIVVFDDFRAVQAPGTAAAIWESVATDGLVPFATTESKLYGTWGDPAPHLATLREFAKRRGDMPHNDLVIKGHTVLRFKEPKTEPLRTVTDADLTAFTEVVRRQLDLQPVIRPALRRRAVRLARRIRR